MDQKTITEYVKQSAMLMELSIKYQDLSGIVVNFATIAAIATQVMEFPLPEDLEIAPEFEP